MDSVADCAPTSRAGTADFERLERETDAVVRSAIRDSSAEGARRRAALALRWRTVNPRGVDRAVTLLADARRAHPHDADLLNDLAVAQMVAAQQARRIEPLLAALEDIEEALALDATHPAALFNRALILSRLHLLAQADRAWAIVVEREPDASWRAEAAARRHALQGRMSTRLVPDTSGWLDASPSDAQARALVELAPEQVRALAWSLFGRWSAAIADGDSTAGARVMSAARAIATAERAAGRGLVVARTLAMIDSLADDPRRTRELAAAHRDLAEGYRAYVDGAFAPAVDRLTAAEAGFRELGAAATGWAAYFQGASLASMGRYAAADEAFARAATSAAPGDAALVAKSSLALGVTQMRRGRFEAAIVRYREAVPAARAAREPDLDGYASFLLAEVLALAGQDSEGLDEGYRSLELLSRLRRSDYLGYHLSNMAEVTAARGLEHVTLALRDEMVDVVSAIGRPQALALAFCSRARDRAALGQDSAAMADLQSAMEWAAKIPSGPGQDRTLAVVQVTRGEVLTRVRPREAIAALEVALHTLVRFERDLYVPEALYQRARAAIAVGDRAGARRAGRAALAALEEQQAAFRSTGRLATFSESAERIADLLIDEELKAKRPDEALQSLEHVRRASWLAASRAPSIRMTPAMLRAKLPPGTTLIEYGVLPDRVIAWVVTRDQIEVHTLAMPRDTLATIVGALPAALRGDTRVADSILTALHQRLLAPLGDAVDAADRLVVVPDRELHAVPFAALRDVRGEYVLQRHEVSVAPSAAYWLAVSHATRSVGSESPVLIVDAPTLGREAARRYGALPGAAREAASVAALHGRSEVLGGQTATRGAVRAALRRAAVLHFAGHAIFDADRPERSYLALAPAGAQDDGQLTAAEIAEMRLSNLRLVILSACSTLGARPSRAGGSAGLAFSFLAAGAPASVSTMWDVRDDASSELLIALHRALVAGRSPAAALRGAQLEALRSKDAEVRAPRTWAAFTYTGP